MRFLPTSTILLGIIVSVAQADSRLVWQPVQEYFIHLQPGREPVTVSGTKRLNSFTAYTHLGTDFGFHGKAEHDISWQTDEICVHLGQEPDCWAGVWHSLSGLAREQGKSLNFTAAWPGFIQARFQPKISSLRLDASGQGRIKLEIKAEDGQIRWANTVEVQSRTLMPYLLPISDQAIQEAKLITWTVEPGSEICISSLNLGIETAGVPFDEYVVAASYAKLARCYDLEGGLVRDRAHLEDGAFESIASTGLFALATAVVSQEPLGIVSREFALKTLNDIHKAVKALERPLGLLPHFVRRGATGYAIHPGTEFSTVDTALFYHSLLLGAKILGDEALTAELSAAVGQVDFSKLRLVDGVISHGLKDDGRTLLPHGWADWGGESALVMMLERMADDQAPCHIMERPGQAWQGTGFIPEIQSLFYPDFDSDTPDALDGVKWLSARLRMLAAQKDYIQRTWKNTPSARMGLYGLSAGEGEHGDRYLVGGVDLPDQSVIHPHYILMSAALTEPAETYALLGRMEKAGYFTPWGMVETISITERTYLPMAGSLNAAFETLGAYHLLAKHRGMTNAIYQAALHSADLRRGVELFYPEPVVEPVTAKLEEEVIPASVGGGGQ